MTFQSFEKEKKQYKDVLEHSTIIYDSKEKDDKLQDGSTVYAKTLSNGKERALKLHSKEINGEFLKLQGNLFLNQVINNNYTIDEVKDFLLENILFDGKKFDELLDKVLNIEINKHILYVPIYGVEFENPLNFGDIEFVNKELIKSKITSDILNESISDMNEHFFAEIEINSASKKRAIELAKQNLEDLLNMIRFITFSKNKQFDASVSNFTISKHVRFLNDKPSIVSKKEGFKQPLNLEHSVFTEGDSIKKLLKLQSKDRNNFEERLLNSIRWIGQALTEENLEMKFTKTMTAIEALLEKNTGKIKKTLGGLTAVIIGENKDKKERDNIFKDFKNMYGKRSEILHGEISELTIYDLYLLMGYTQMLIYWAIDNLSNFNNINKVYKEYSSYEDYLK